MLNYALNDLTDAWFAFPSQATKVGNNFKQFTNSSGTQYTLQFYYVAMSTLIFYDYLLTFADEACSFGWIIFGYLYLMLSLYSLNMRGAVPLDRLVRWFLWCGDDILRAFFIFFKVFILFLWVSVVSFFRFHRSWVILWYTESLLQHLLRYYFIIR